MYWQTNLMINKKRDKIEQAKSCQKRLKKYNLPNSAVAKVVSISEPTFRKLKSNKNVAFATWYLTNTLIDLNFTFNLIEQVSDKITLENIQRRYKTNCKELEKAKALLKEYPSIYEISNITKIPYSSLQEYRLNPNKLKNTRWTRVYDLATLYDCFNDIENYKKSRISEYLRLNNI